MRETERAAARRRGGQGKATFRRSARQWAAAGEAITPADLPGLLRGCVVAVLAGSLTPGEAQAIATLARSSVVVAEAVEMERRLEAVETSLGITPAATGLRRVK